MISFRHSAQNHRGLGAAVPLPLLYNRYTRRYACTDPIRAELMRLPLEERRPIGYLMAGYSLRYVAAAYEVPLTTMHRRVKRIFKAVEKAFNTRRITGDAEVQQA